MPSNGGKGRRVGVKPLSLGGASQSMMVNSNDVSVLDKTRSLGLFLWSSMCMFVNISDVSNECHSFETHLKRPTVLAGTLGSMWFNMTSCGTCTSIVDLFRLLGFNMTSCGTCSPIVDLFGLLGFDNKGLEKNI